LGANVLTWYLYVVRTKENYLYTGVATNVKRRFKEHKSQGRKAAKYLLAHQPKSLAFSKSIGGRSLALKVEYRFKALAKKDKELIIKQKKLTYDKGTGKIIMPYMRKNK
jgi:putative endonuclease